MFEKYKVYIKPTGISITLGGLAALGLWAGFNHSDNNSERRINLCAGRLGDTKTTFASLPNGCRASDTGVTVNSITMTTSNNDGQTSSGKVISYTIPSRHTFLKENDYRDRFFDDLTPIVLGVGIAAVGTSLSATVIGFRHIRYEDGGVGPLQAQA